MSLKKVEGSMPYELDLHWDIKMADDITRFDLQDNATLHRILAENSYDVKGWIFKMNSIWVLLKTEGVFFKRSDNVWLIKTMYGKYVWDENQETISPLHGKFNHWGHLEYYGKRPIEYWCGRYVKLI